MFNLVSLFSGAGALDLGFERTGRVRSVLRVEMQPEFCETLENAQRVGYLERATTVRADIRSLNPSEIGVFLPAPLGVIGGPPCETFSTMGRRAGGADPRGQLVFEFARWVVALDPEFFVMENVPGLETASNGTLLRRFVEDLEDSGYTVGRHVLCAADYGAATLRSRLIVIGTKSQTAVPSPAPTHGDPGGQAMGLRPWRTVEDALRGLPSPSPTAPGVPSGHVGIRHSAAVSHRFSQLSQGSYDNIRKRSKLTWTRPSPSLVAGNLKGIRSHIHPLEPRELTNRESARIQGFPDEYEFVGSPAAVGKQIANAVPVELAAAVARAVVEHSASTRIRAA